jgi:hypothetical protein
MEVREATARNANLSQLELALKPRRSYAERVIAGGASPVPIAVAARPAPPSGRNQPTRTRAAVQLQRQLRTPFLRSVLDEATIAPFKNRHTNAIEVCLAWKGWRVMSGSDHGAVDFPAMGSLDIGDANDLLRSIRATYGLVYPLLLIEPSKITSFVTSIKISNWEGGRDDISSSFALYDTIPDDDRIFISKIIAMDGDNRGTIEIVGRYSCLRTSFRAAEAWLDDDEGRVFNARYCWRNNIRE